MSKHNQDQKDSKATHQAGEGRGQENEELDLEEEQ